MFVLSFLLLLRKPECGALAVQAALVFAEDLIYAAALTLEWL